MNVAVLKSTGFSRNRNTMAQVKDYIKPETSIGTLFTVGIQVILLVAFVIADHNNSETRAQDMIQLHGQMEQVLQALPVTNKIIEVNGNRISQLEQSEREVETRISALEAQYGIAHSDLEQLKETVREIVEAAQKSPGKR
jgi:ABC-type siderophore export system fused ATPase/permease subunit